jgi:hypothetical protein
MATVDYLYIYVLHCQALGDPRLARERRLYACCRSKGPGGLAGRVERPFLAGVAARNVATGQRRRFRRWGTRHSGSSPEAAACLRASGGPLAGRRQVGWSGETRPPEFDSPVPSSSGALFACADAPMANRGRDIRHNSGHAPVTLQGGKLPAIETDSLTPRSPARSIDH